MSRKAGRRVREGLPIPFLHRIYRGAGDMGSVSGGLRVPVSLEYRDTVILRFQVATSVRGRVEGTSEQDALLLLGAFAA